MNIQSGLAVGQSPAHLYRDVAGSDDGGDGVVGADETGRAQYTTHNLTGDSSPEPEACLVLYQDYIESESQ